MESWPEIYSWKLRPLFKGIPLASLGPIVENWSLKAFDKTVELVTEIPFRLKFLKEDLPVLREGGSLIAFYACRRQIR